MNNERKKKIDRDAWNENKICNLRNVSQSISTTWKVLVLNWASQVTEHEYKHFDLNENNFHNSISFIRSLDWESEGEKNIYK